MSKVIDARGLSCPQPVLLTLKAMKDATINHLEILVDTDTSKENVIRAVESQNWKVEKIEGYDNGYKITISKN